MGEYLWILIMPNGRHYFKYVKVCKHIDLKKNSVCSGSESWILLFWCHHCPWVTSTKSKPIHLCKIKFSNL